MSGTPSIEQALRDALLELGERDARPTWRGRELRAEASWGSRPLRLRLLPLPALPRTALDSPPDPFFALARVGEPSGQAEAWGIVRRGGLAAQVAAGPGWVAAAAPIAPAGAYTPLVGALFDVLRAVLPRPGSGQDAGGEWAFADLEASPPRSSHRATLGGAGLAAASGVAALAAAVAPELLPVAATLVYSLLPAGLLMLGVGWAARRAVGRDLRQGDRVLRALRRSRLLDKVGRPLRLPPQQGPVVPAGLEDRPLAAHHGAFVVAARSTDHGLEMRLALHDVLWPSRPRVDCVLLPDCWAAVELRGPGEVLARLPAGPRETRGRGVVRWLLDGDDLGRDALADLLLQAESSLGAEAQGPYR